MRQRLSIEGVHNRDSQGKGNNDRAADRGVQKSKRDRLGNDGRHPDRLDTEQIFEEQSIGQNVPQEEINNFLLIR